MSPVPHEAGAEERYIFRDTAACRLRPQEQQLENAISAILGNVVQVCTCPQGLADAHNLQACLTEVDESG